MIYTVYDNDGRHCGVITSSSDSPIVQDGWHWVEGEQSKYTRWVDGNVEWMSQSEISAIEDADAWDILRSERNRRLSACDWTQTADAPVDRAAWAAYRQALRDLPANTDDPRDPQWPSPPA